MFLNDYLILFNINTINYDPVTVYIMCSLTEGLEFDDNCTVALPPYADVTVYKVPYSNSLRIEAATFSP